MSKKSRSGIRIRDEHPGPDHISVSLETIFWVKILKFFDAYADPDPGIFLALNPVFRMEKNSDPGSEIRDKHPQHCRNEIICIFTGANSIHPDAGRIMTSVVWVLIRPELRW
jgi:hypothetical protein